MANSWIFLILLQQQNHFWFNISIVFRWITVTSAGALTCCSRRAALFEAWAFCLPAELQMNLSLRLCESDDSTQSLLTPVSGWCSYPPPLCEIQQHRAQQIIGRCFFFLFFFFMKKRHGFYITPLNSYFIVMNQNICECKWQRFTCYLWSISRAACSILSHPAGGASRVLPWTCPDTTNTLVLRPWT